MKEKGRKSHTELSEGNAVRHEKHTFAHKHASTFIQQISARENRGGKVK